MDRLESGRTDAHFRPELVGLGVLLLCALAGWFSLLGFGAQGWPPWRGDGGLRVWREFAGLGALCVIAAFTSQRCGLLALVCEARGRAPTCLVGRWLYLLAHFKVSFAVLLASLAFSWWARARLLVWLLDPASWPAPYAIDHVVFGPQGPPLLLITLSVAWLPVVPFLASDAWRLLLPLMVPRAARLHLPFAAAALVVALATLLLIRHHGISLYLLFEALYDVERLKVPP